MVSPGLSVQQEFKTKANYRYFYPRSLYKGNVCPHSNQVNGNLLNGDFPVSKLKLVQAWAEIHKEELLTMWNTKEFHKVTPLQ